MKLTELRRSSSKEGGWLARGKPARDTKAVMQLVGARWMARYELWWLSDAALACLEKHCINYGEMATRAGYIGPEKQQRQEPPKPPPPRPVPLSPFGAMYLRDNAPDEVVHAAYRALAKLWHPDLARDEADRRDREERMKLLNWAYDAIKKIRGWM